MGGKHEKVPPPAGLFIIVLIVGAAAFAFFYQYGDDAVGQFRASAGAQPDQTSQPSTQEPTSQQVVPQSPATTSERVVYIYGSGLIARKDNQDLVYQHQDYLSSNRFASDSSGRLVSRSVQEPYGTTLEDVGTNAGLANDYAFTGKEHDDRLYYFGARYYDPRTARFVSVDPIARIESPYDYAANNPMKFVDPDGKRMVWAPKVRWLLYDPILVEQQTPAFDDSTYSNIVTEVRLPNLYDIEKPFVYHIESFEKEGQHYVNVQGPSIDMTFDSLQNEKVGCGYSLCALGLRELLSGKVISIGQRFNTYKRIYYEGEKRIEDKNAIQHSVFVTTENYFMQFDYDLETERWYHRATSKRDVEKKGPSLWEDLNELGRRYKNSEFTRYTNSIFDQIIDDMESLWQ